MVMNQTQIRHFLDITSIPTTLHEHLTSVVAPEVYRTYTGDVPRNPPDFTSFTTGNPYYIYSDKLPYSLYKNGVVPDETTPNQFQILTLNTKLENIYYNLSFKALFNFINKD